MIASCFLDGALKMCLLLHLMSYTVKYSLILISTNYYCQCYDDCSAAIMPSSCLALGRTLHAQHPGCPGHSCMWECAVEFWPVQHDDQTAFLVAISTCGLPFILHYAVFSVWCYFSWFTRSSWMRKTCPVVKKEFRCQQWMMEKVISGFRGTVAVAEFLHLRKTCSKWVQH